MLIAAAFVDISAQKAGEICAHSSSAEECSMTQVSLLQTTVALQTSKANQVSKSELDNNMLSLHVKNDALDMSKLDEAYQKYVKESFTRNVEVPNPFPKNPLGPKMAEAVCRWVPNHKNVGADVTDTVMPIRNTVKQECCDLCGGNSACKSAVHESATGSCWLKSEAQLVHSPDSTEINYFSSCLEPKRTIEICEYCIDLFESFSLFLNHVAYPRGITWRSERCASTTSKLPQLCSKCKFELQRSCLKYERQAVWFVSHINRAPDIAGYAPKTVEDMVACEKLCIGYPTCNSAQYDTTSRECALKNKIQLEYIKNGTISSIGKVFVDEAAWRSNARRRRGLGHGVLTPQDAMNVLYPYSALADEMLAQG